MADDVLGTETLELQPGDVAVPYTFRVTVCSSADGNDGFIPYGTNVSSLVATTYNSSDAAKTDILNNTYNYSVTDNLITFYLDYPTVSGIGLYKLKGILTLDNGRTTKAFVFLNIKAINKRIAS